MAEVFIKHINKHCLFNILKCIIIRANATVFLNQIGLLRVLNTVGIDLLQDAVDVIACKNHRSSVLFSFPEYHEYWSGQINDLK